MKKVTQWIRYREMQWFNFINQRVRHFMLDFVFKNITHLGGATATLSINILLWITQSGSLRTASIQALLSLFMSHLPVAWIKKKYRRQRPYEVIASTNLNLHPLKDHSFPSGHTTAIFACILPYVFWHPLLAVFLFPLALIVGYSRIYNGLHFPSDCLVGMVIGSLSGSLIVIGWNFV